MRDTHVTLIVSNLFPRIEEAREGVTLSSDAASDDVLLKKTYTVERLAIHVILVPFLVLPSIFVQFSRLQSISY